MVRTSAACATFLMLCAPFAADAESPTQQMFPRNDSCYARSYDAGHLASHPDQRVTRVALRPDFTSEAPLMVLDVRLSLRGAPGGEFEALAICENTGGSIYCAMEGDASGFQIEPAKNRSILITVSSLGMSFENESGFVTLERNAGDDRSFLLRPEACR